MKITQEKALFHLTGKTDIADLKMDAIESLVNEYPFFSPGQYLFSAKLKKDDHPLAASQAIKTALFFSNPYWLQFQLDSLKDAGIDQAPKQDVDTELLRTIRQKDKDWDEMMELPQIETTIEESQKSLETIAELPNPDITIPTIESVREMMQGINSFTKPSMIVPVIRETVTDPADMLSMPEPVSEVVMEAFQPVFSAIALSESQPELSPQPEATPATEPSPYKTLPDQAKSDAKIASILSGQLAEFKKPVVETNSLEINYPQEKMHTVDYFASQGIRIDLSKVPQDELTTKLRKFTDWLKSMKNNAQDSTNPSDLGTSPELEKAAAETALISNESREILTETMAEVLVKQGQIDKAIQLYIKLSFSNPEKTTYFAAKIQQLKGI